MYFAENETLTNFRIFHQNHGLTPLEKNANFVGFLNPCFRCSKRLVCYIKRRKSFFHDLFSRSMTWKYRGLQGVTEGYKGLQGVTRYYKGLQRVTGSYKGLQGVTGCDKGLQGVTKDYRNLFPTRTFPDTLSWSILHKNQS